MTALRTALACTIPLAALHPGLSRFAQDGDGNCIAGRPRDGASSAGRRACAGLELLGQDGRADRREPAAMR